jgi:hypothetical protein
LILENNKAFDIFHHLLQNVIMIQKQVIVYLLVALIYIVNGDNYQYSSCKRFENKIYQLTVTFPDKTPFNAALRLLPNGVFDELFSIENGNNSESLGLNISFSNRIGYYKCLGRNNMRLTGLGYLYESPDVDFLENNGAVVVHDYYFRFLSNDKNLIGAINFDAFTVGTNPFTTKDAPVFKGEIGKVKGELLRFRTNFNLTTTTG